MQEDENPGYQRPRSGRVKAAVQGTFWSLINTLVPTLISIAVFTITSRVLTPAEFGIVAFVTSVTTFASAIAPVGFSEAVIQKDNITKLHLNSIFWLCMGSAVVIYALLMLSALPISQAFDRPGMVPYLAVIGLRVFFDLGSGVPNALLIRSMKFHRIAMRTTIASVVAALICLVVLWLGHGVWALLLSTLTASIASFTGSVLSVDWKPGFSFSKAALAEIRRFGLYASGNRMLGLVSPDQLLIGALMGDRELGLYGFAKRLFDIISNLISGVLGSVSYSVFASLQSEQEKMRNGFLLVTSISALATFPVFSALAATASELIPFIFGDQWISAIPTLQAFCVMGFFAGIGVLQASLIKSQGKADWWLRYHVINQLLTTLIIVFLHDYGTAVIVSAIALKTLFYWPVSVTMTCRLIKLPILTYLNHFTVPLLASALMFVTIIELLQLLQEYSAIVRILLAGAGGGIVYCVIVMLFSGRSVINAFLTLRKGVGKT